MIAVLARYGRQPIWGPGGVLNAPWDEVVAMAAEISALIALENKKPDPLKREDR